MVFERFRAVLNEVVISNRSAHVGAQDKYKDNPILAEGLDLVEEDRITHEI